MQPTPPPRCGALAPARRALAPPARPASQQPTARPHNHLYPPPPPSPPQLDLNEYADLTWEEFSGKRLGYAADQRKERLQASPFSHADVRVRTPRGTLGRDQHACSAAQRDAGCTRHTAGAVACVGGRGRHACGACAAHFMGPLGDACCARPPPVAGGVRACRLPSPSTGVPRARSARSRTRARWVAAWRCSLHAHQHVPPGSAPPWPHIDTPSPVCRPPCALARAPTPCSAAAAGRSAPRAPSRA